MGQLEQRRTDRGLCCVLAKSSGDTMAVFELQEPSQEGLFGGPAPDP